MRATALGARKAHGLRRTQAGTAMQVAPLASLSWRSLWSLRRDIPDGWRLPPWPEYSAVGRRPQIPNCSNLVMFVLSD